jgi:glycosyltransferase involved in cell wall biosynthesis
MRAVSALAEQLAPGGVILTGSIPDAELAARYATADVFVCLSEHEGFCVPIVEAMLAGLPVIAYAAGAVPETMDGAGLLVESTDAIVLAELVQRLLSDSSLRLEICRRQTERAREIQAIPRDRMLVDAVQRILA